MSSNHDSFYVTGGALQRDAPCYVVRRADRELYEGLSQGEFCYVLTARQIGKSSLMVHTAARLREAGFGVAVLDLTAIGQNVNPEQWYGGLLTQVGRPLALEDDLVEFWEEYSNLNPLQRWTRAIRNVVLCRNAGRVAIFVDEIDAVRSLPFSTDEFFAGIRELYSRRTEDSELNRLSICLLGVATPSDLIRDSRTTPFNIGRRVELPDFSADEAAPLAQGLGREPGLGVVLLNRVLHWTAGHPYLTQRLCQVIAEDQTATNASAVDRICANLFFTSRAREQDANLLFVRERILRSDGDLAALLSLYRDVLQHKRVRDDDMNPVVSMLRLSGIVGGERGTLTVRNRIYARAFDQEWVKTNMPDAEVRRQRAAYRRGALRAMAMATVVLVIIAILALVAYRQGNLAKQREQAYRRLLYTAQMGLAQQAYEVNDVTRVKELLADTGAKANEEDLRGFEWYYLRQLSHKSHDLLGHEHDIYSTAISPDGTIVATGGEDKTVKLWDLAARRGIGTFNVYEIVRSLAFSPDSKTLAAASGETIKLWDMASHEEMPPLRARAGVVWSVAFSGDGQYLAAGSNAGTTSLWDVKQRLIRQTLKGHTGPVSSVMFSPDSLSLATGSYDHAAKIWDIASGQGRATLLGHTDRLCCVAFSSDGKRLITGSADRSVKVWDIISHRLLATVNMHLGSVQAVVLFPDDRTLAGAGEEGVLKLWDLATEQEVAVFNGEAGRIYSCALSPAAKTLATGGSDHILRLWDIGVERQERAFLAREGLKAVSFSPDGRILVMRSEDHKILILRDLVRRQELGAFKLPASTALFVALSHDGRFMGVATADNTVRLWDIAAQAELPAIRIQTGTVSAAAFAPGGERLATGSLDHSATLWDVATGRTQMTFQGHNGPVNCVAFSPDGRILATGTTGAVKLWDVISRRELTTFSGQWGETWALAFSPEAKILAAGLNNRTVKLWDVATRRERATLRAHASSVLTIAFSRDGRRLATGSADSTVRLWDVSNGQPLLTFREHTSAVTQLIFGAEPSSLESISVGGIAKVWHAPIN